MENTQETTNANKLRKARAVNNATTTADALRGDTDTASFMGEMLSLDMKMPAHPAFPFLMLILAIMKDAIDIVSLGFLGIFTSITFGIIIGIWVTQKVGIVRKLLFKKVIIRALILLFVGIFPLLSMFPDATVLVILTFTNELKIVNGIYSALEVATGKLL